MNNKNYKNTLLSVLIPGLMLAIITGCNNRNNLEDTKKQAKYVALIGSEKFGSTNKAAYSDDGINWTITKMPRKANWSDVCYGGD